MAITGNITISGNCSGQTPSQVITKTGDAAVPINATIASSQTDQLFNIAFDKDRLEMVYLLSDVDLTIETNDGTTPGDTITLNAGEPLIWWKDSAEYTNPFASADVTAWYITSTDAGTLQGFILHDPTA